uniref:Uncharacterized protein n=1 Tax=Glossina austeni TaxID=7395 RepID=A0A1A9V4W7_GLOAU
MFTTSWVYFDYCTVRNNTEPVPLKYYLTLRSARSFTLIEIFEEGLLLLCLIKIHSKDTAHSSYRSYVLYHVVCITDPVVLKSKKHQGMPHDNDL